MNNPTPRPESTHSPEQASEAPAGVQTDQGAREALVERLAEAIGNALANEEASWVIGARMHEELTRAATEAVTPLVAAEVEAAVSPWIADLGKAVDERDAALAAVSVVRAEREAEVEHLWAKVHAEQEQVSRRHEKQRAAEARLDALVADLRGLADEWDAHFSEFGIVNDWDAGASAVYTDLRVVIIDKHAGGK